MARKAIYFDLDDKKLSQHYTRPAGMAPHKLEDKEGNPRDNLYAYDEIEKYLTDRGFKHRQYSGYISKEDISLFKVRSVLEGLKEEFTWLSDTGVVKKLDVMSIGKEYSFGEMFNAKGAKERPLVEVMEEAARKAREKEKTRVKQPHKEKEPEL